MNRRKFLSLSAMTMTSSMLAGCLATPQTAKPMNILVLGGTNFLGPSVVERALFQGHNVTIFNRGITRPELFPGIEKLRGNRLTTMRDLSAIENARRWDAVLDLWPEQASMVDDTTKVFRERADYYYFCSSIAVYRDFSQPGITEDSPVHNDSGWYGAEKIMAEKLVAERFNNRFGVCRCHSLFGPKDNGVAFHYWTRKLATQEKVLAPGNGLDPIQFADVRDVAAWIVNCAETRRSGTYNLCGHRPPLLFKDFLSAIKAGIESSSQLIWVDADFLRQKQGISSFLQMPLWAPLDEDAGFFQISGEKALSAGATYRPLSQTAKDSWHWFQSYYFKDTTFPVGGWGIPLEKESQVLDAWSKLNS